MRKSKEEAAQTRRRIVTAAAAKFRKNGIVATGLDELMAAAGLTRGGFYKHFESKNQLIAEACAQAAESMIVETIGTATARGKRPAAEYLSTRHRDHPESGCPLSALGAELARSDQQTRSIATEGVLKLVEIMTGERKEMPRSTARRHALSAVSIMVGALTLSRMVNDPKLSLEILRAAEKSVSEAQA